MRRMTTAQLQQLSASLEPDFVVVTYLDPRTSGTTTKTFYSSSISSAVQRVSDGVAYWINVGFNLIEK